MSNNKTVTYQFYSLENLDERGKLRLVQSEVDKMLNNKKCSICGSEFTGSWESDNAICSGENPITYAHEYCFHPPSKEDVIIL